MEDFKDCLVNQERVKELFAGCRSDEERYKVLIELGRNVRPLEEKYKVPENVVPGCQSVMHLHAWKEGDCVFFEAESEALVSSGLAQILIRVYSGLKPEVILKCPPDFLHELRLSQSLSPTRANGIYSIHLKMKQEALRLLLN